MNESDSDAYRSAHWMTIGVAVLFFGTGAVQQYIAVWFQDRGVPHVGKNTLVLVYLFYFLGSFQAHRVLDRFGCRACMMATSVMYGLLIVSVWSTSVWLSYTSAILSGLCASFLWTGQAIVINRISDISQRSNTARRFWTCYPLGTGLGTLALGALIGQFSYDVPILTFSLFAFGSCLFFTRMPSHEQTQQLSTSASSPSFHPMTVGSALTVFSLRFISGLVISQVPLDLRESFGTAYVGLVSSPFFILPLIALFADKRGLLLSAPLGFTACGLGLVCLLAPMNGAGIILGVLLIAIACTVLNPVSNLLPKRISDATGIDLSRIAATFSLAGSAGILAGLLSVALIDRANSYALALGLLLASASCLWLVGRAITLGEAKVSR